MKKACPGAVWAILLLFPCYLLARARKPAPVLRSDFYMGEGWAELGSDKGAAREQAKIRALGDLARNVRVTVRSALIDVLGQTAGQPRQSLESKINAYAEIPSTRLDREEFILNEPRRGQLTCRVAINRARYDNEVRRDLLNKKNRALEDAHAAHAALVDGRLADAWNALSALQHRATVDFPRLSLEGDADGDGKTEDVLSWARSRQRELRVALNLTCTPGPYIFGDDGRYAGDPTARLSWTHNSAVRLDGFPLRARWTHRPDAVAAQSFSDKRGDAPFHPSVDLFVESSLLTIDLEGGDGDPEVACQSAFHRRRQAAVTVTADRNDVQTKMLEETLARLKRWPWDVRVAETPPPRGSSIHIALDVHTAIARHPEGDIYRATLILQATIFSGYLGKEVFRGQGPTAVAFGATPADAVRHALENSLPQLGPWLDDHVNQLP